MGIADKPKLLIAFWTYFNRSCESVHRVYLCSGLNEMTNVMEWSPPWVFQLLNFSFWTWRLIITFIYPTTKPYPTPVESTPSYQASLKVLFNSIAMLTFRLCEQNFASIFHFCLACYKYPILPSLARTFPCFLSSTARKRDPLTFVWLALLSGYRREHCLEVVVASEWPLAVCLLVHAFLCISWVFVCVIFVTKQ
jgi:hypothetical protein